MRATVTALWCIVLGIVPLSAQRLLPIEPGMRVRLTAPDCGLRERQVTFEALRGDTLVADGGVTLRCPLAAVTSFDLYRGRRSHLWRGAGIGLLVGAGVGFVGYYAAVNSCYEGADVSGCALVFGAGGGGLVGALVGALVGSLWETEQWVSFPLGGVSVEPVGTPRGLGLAASVRF